MTLTGLHRRKLIGNAVGGCAAWFGGGMSFRALWSDRTRLMSDHDALLVLCSDLSYPKTIGKACLDALPATDASGTHLIRAILADIRPVRSQRGKTGPISTALRARSRQDFREGRVIAVDGWILSLTEVRLYALAALCPTARVSED